MNQRPSGYEPDELPGCSTPQSVYIRSAAPVCQYPDQQPRTRGRDYAPGHLRNARIIRSRLGIVFAAVGAMTIASETVFGFFRVGRNLRYLGFGAFVKMVMGMLFSGVPQIILGVAFLFLRKQLAGAVMKITARDEGISPRLP